MGAYGLESLGLHRTQMCTDIDMEAPKRLRTRLGETVNQPSSHAKPVARARDAE